MRLVCCCDGDGSDALIRRSLARLGAVSTLVLVHCIDSGPEHDVHFIQDRVLHHHHHHLHERHEAEMAESLQGRAVTILEEAAVAARAAGFVGDLQTRALHGRPEREIVHLLGEEGADAVALFPRPPARQHGSGPHSVGHVARFIIDHAPCDVLLLRGAGGR
jgi:nucleotide-binding universal stress UspA family protein